MNLGKPVDLVNPDALRAGGLAGFHFEDERCYLFLGEDGSAFVADSLRARFLDNFKQASATLRIDFRMGDEGKAGQSQRSKCFEGICVIFIRPFFKTVFEAKLGHLIEVTHTAKKAACGYEGIVKMFP